MMTKADMTRAAITSELRSMNNLTEQIRSIERGLKYLKDCRRAAAVSALAMIQDAITSDLSMADLSVVMSGLARDMARARDIADEG